MGVNMAGNCIVDDEICKEASRQEIIRRYYKSCDALVSGTGKEDEVCKIELLLKQAHASIEDRKVVPAALSMERKQQLPLLLWNFRTERLFTEKPLIFSEPPQRFF